MVEFLLTVACFLKTLRFSLTAVTNLLHLEVKNNFPEKARLASLPAELLAATERFFLSS